MNRFVVAVFPDLAGAQEGARVLKELASEGSVQMNGAATISKAPDGELTMDVVADDGPAVATTGALIGGLAGLATGPLAAVVLAVGGAVLGASAGLTNRSAGLNFAKRVTRDLAHGSTALIAEITVDDESIIFRHLESIGGTITLHETTET